MRLLLMTSFCLITSMCSRGTLQSVSRNLCSGWVEDRLHAVLNNYFYIEHPLQPSYTAAMFFLFQDATVRDVLTFANKSESLQFDRNIQEMAVRLSIPAANMILTLIGCTCLGIGAIAVALYAHIPQFQGRHDPLCNVDKPHVIAQVMLDESKSPSLVLQRHLVDLLHDQSTHHEVETFMIQALGLEHPHSKTPIKFGQDSDSASTHKATKSDSHVEDIKLARSH